MHEIRDRRDKHWFWIDDAVIDDHAATIGPWALALYVVLVRHANKQHHCYPSMRHLEKILGATRHTIRKHLHVLVEHGLIAYTTRTTEDGKDTSSLYTILSPNSAIRQATSLAAPGVEASAPTTDAQHAVSGEGVNFHPSQKDLPGEGVKFHPSRINFHPKGIGFKELDSKEEKTPFPSFEGEQKKVDPHSGEQIADRVGEHHVSSSDESSMVRTTHTPDAPAPHAPGEFDRTELHTLLRNVWREWGMEEDGADQPPAPPTDHGPAP